MADQKKDKKIKLQVGSVIKSNTSQYRILSELGSGGNGCVFFVLCQKGENKGCYFALKILYSITSPERIKRFTNEIEFLKQNQNIAILGHFDDGVHIDGFNQYPFVVTNYLRQTLNDEMKKGISLYKGLMYTTQLLASLKYLQSNNYVHRDIKPANIFINNFHAMLGDFGLLKKLDSSTGCEEDKKNIYEYYSDGNAMARNYKTPQLLEYAEKGSGLTLKSDIFQLGLVIHEIFTGENPLKPKGGNQMRLVFGNIPSKKYEGRIMGLIKVMVNLDETKIKEVDSLISSWMQILIDYTNDQNELTSKFLDLY